MSVTGTQLLCLHSLRIDSGTKMNILFTHDQFVLECTVNGTEFILFVYKTSKIEDIIKIIELNSVSINSIAVMSQCELCLGGADS